MTFSDAFFRRPLLWAFPLFAAGAICASRLGPLPAAAVFTAAFLVGASLVRRGPLGAAALLCAALSAGWALPGAAAREPLAGESALTVRAHGEPVHLGGTVVSDVSVHPRPHGGESISFILDARRIWDSPSGEGRPVKGRVRVTADASFLDWAYGDTGVFKGRLEVPPGRRNPGGFDARAYWQSKGVRFWLLAGGADSQRRLERGKGCPLIRAALGAKRRLSAALERSLPSRDAAILRAMILGEKGGLDRPLKRLFVETGTIHLLVVSGANVAFVIAIVWGLTAVLPVGHRTRWAAAIAAVWGYGLLVGWQPPVVRACLMATAVLAGRLAGGRRADALNSLGLAAIVTIALSPSDLRDAGFWLSGSCVWGLVVLFPRLAGSAAEGVVSWAGRLRRGASELFWASFVCQLVTLPILAALFHAVPLYAVATNLAAVPLAGLVFVTGVAHLGLFGWWSAPAWVSLPVTGLIRALLELLEVAERLPGRIQVLGVLPVWILAVAVAGAIAILLRSRPRQALLRAAISVVWIATVLSASIAAREAGRGFELTMLDVGQGDALVIRFADGTTMLVDAGRGGGADEGERTVVPYLRWSGIRRLDWVVLSHPQEDHAGGLFTVLESTRVDRLVIAEAARERMGRYGELLGRKKPQTVEWSSGERIEERAFTIDVLSPGPAFASEINDLSIVFVVRAPEASVLLTGDAGEKALGPLLADAKKLDADVLKVPHHGAKQGGSFARLVRAVGPRVSLISARRGNPYGHPHPATVAALRAIPGNRVFRTDRDGAVRVTMRDGKPVVSAMRPYRS